MAAWDFLPFHPHPLCRGRHAQTVASTLPLIRLPPNRATLRFVALADGDQLALHDDQPAAWQPGNRTSLMVHGLGGSHASGYMRRIAAKLNGIGVRTFRLDLRGCGAGFGFAKQPYYGGCSDDLAATVRRVGELCPGSPLSLIGFSLGANVVLKLLGELRGRPLAGVDHAMAISPPIDLERCSQSLLQGFNRVYDRYFVATLMRRMRRQAIRVPDSPAARFRERPRSLFEFDDRFTAPTWGFSGARDYYRQCSSLALLGQIEVPTIIITARDDPFIPYKAIESAKLSADVALHATPSGGHLGFIAGRNADPDRHWLDWRVVDCHRALNTRQSCNAKLN
jgi:predicted alpha/beta-fold hydrolase